MPISKILFLTYQSEGNPKVLTTHSLLRHSNTVSEGTEWYDLYGKEENLAILTLPLSHNPVSPTSCGLTCTRSE